MRTRSLTATGIALAAAIIGIGFSSGSCSKTPEEPGNSKAYRVTDRSQLIGGPTALGDIGDGHLRHAFEELEP